MLLVKIPLVLSAIATIIIHVACNTFHETNAQRMARGLPPSPPRFGRNLPGKIMDARGTRSNIYF
jgi:hypothetical protein